MRTKAKIEEEIAALATEVPEVRRGGAPTGSGRGQQKATSRNAPTPASAKGSQGTTDMVLTLGVG